MLVRSGFCGAAMPTKHSVEGSIIIASCKLETVEGFEPPLIGFAGRRISALPYRHCLDPEAGLEPALQHSECCVLPVRRFRN